MTHIETEKVFIIAIAIVLLTVAGIVGYNYRQNDREQAELAEKMGKLGCNQEIVFVAGAYNNKVWRCTPKVNQ